MILTFFKKGWQMLQFEVISISFGLMEPEAAPSNGKKNMSRQKEEGKEERKERRKMRRKS